MLALLRDPLPLGRLLVIGGAITLAVAIYCVGYSAMSGGQETLRESVTWSIANVLPWLPALEGAKRARSLPVAGFILIAGLLVSLVLGALLQGAADVIFEAWRRLPTFALVSAIALGLRWTNRRASNSNQSMPLPLLPRQIDWVRAAGNYVELRTHARTIVHRASLSSVERELDGHGFIRIHRSLLVRRDRIARIRSDDVVLFDGTHLKIGKRYRADIAA